MSEWVHILDRFVIHFFSAYGLVTGLFFLLNVLRKKTQCANWMPQTYMGLFIEAALLVCMVAFVREPFDVHEGDWWLKSYFDMASWVLGSGVAVWGNYRQRLLVLTWLR